MMLKLALSRLLLFAKHYLQGGCVFDIGTIPIVLFAAFGVRVVAISGVMNVVIYRALAALVAKQLVYIVGTNKPIGNDNK